MITAEDIIPDKAERERIFREVCEKAAAQRETWCKMDEAAAHIRRSKRELYRLIEAYGIPVCRLTKTILRADLDALLLAHLDRSKTPLIAFPSLAKSPCIGATK